jgi:hypothetical protein
MSDILKSEYERKLQQLNSVEDFNLRIREAKYPDLERCLYLWHSEVLRLNLLVADDLMLEKGDMLGISTFGYSRGWLEKFKKRHNISKFKITGEAACVSPDAVKAARERSKKVILEFAEKYGWHNVWNLDEM